MGARSPVAVRPPEPMTPLAAVLVVKDIEAQIGSKAEIYVSLNRQGRAQALSASVYANGSYPERLTFRVEGNSFDELLAAVLAKWAEHRTEYIRQTTDSMALEIIRITDAFGACTDASLRGARYSVADIAAFGEAACRRAAEMAAKGPFEIVPGALANEVAA